MKLTDSMQRIIREHPLGFVATINDDGTPNLSPKGTMLVMDSEHVIFAEIRSPKTLANLRQRPRLEINYIDVLKRVALRLSGEAEIVDSHSSAFKQHIERFSNWSELVPRMRHIVQVKVLHASLLRSPSYDVGQSEAQLMQEYFQRLQGFMEASSLSKSPQ